MAVELLVFEVEQLLLGVPSQRVREVLRAPTLSSLPLAPAGLDGLLNLRGRLLPVVDMRHRLAVRQRPILHTDHLIVVEEPVLLGLRVDRALDLVTVEETEFDPRAMASDSGTSDSGTSDSGTSEAGPSRVAGGPLTIVAQTRKGLVHLVELERLLDGEAGRHVRLAVAQAAAEAGESSKEASR